MIRDLLAHTPLLALPLGALGLFLIVFLANSAHVLGRPRGAYDAVSRLPLDGGDHG